MSLELRTWCVDDSLAELQSLVHRAYSVLAEQGLNYWGTRQTLEETEQRVTSGECWVAVEEGRLVGTVLLKEPRAEGGCDWYEREDTRTFHQLAVEPSRQGDGLGTRLVRHCEARARELGAAELALDTSEHAQRLIDWYLRLGYRQVDHADWRPDTNYLSVILSKDLGSRSGPG